ncbi:MAG: hypothetical protein ABJ327_06940 [Litoreibacter sp.]
MKNRYHSLAIAILMLMMATFHWTIDNTRLKETRVLALQIEAFVKEPLIGTPTHYETRRQTRELIKLIHRNDRTLLIFLHIAVSIQLFIFFFRGSKGKEILAKMARIWTWRP